MRFQKSKPAAVLLFTGDDHQDFLHGQGTADLKGPVGYCRYSLWLDFKGNVLGDGFVLKKNENESLLISDRCLAESLIAKFDRHIIADDVIISDKTGEFGMLSFPADSAAAACDHFEWIAPEEGSFHVHEDCILFSGRNLGTETLQVIAPGNSDFSIDGIRISENEAEYLRIMDGIPFVPDDTDHNSLNPVEMNLMSPLSFTKGCYLGQEVVARVHRLGRVSRRLVRIESTGDSIRKDAILSIDAKEVGKITSVAKNRDNYVAMGWLKSKILDGEIVFEKGAFAVNSLLPS